MKKYQGMLVTCTLCALVAAPAFAQTTTGSTPRNPAATNQQVAPNAGRPDSATGSTSLPGTAAPGTPTDDKATTMGRQDPKAARPGMTGSDSQATRNSSMGRSGMSGNQQNASTEQVRQMQEALKAQGQDPGPIDGRMGTRTQAALRTYQGSNNLTATGQLDAQTMEKLGVAGSSTGKNGGTAPSKDK